MIAPYLAGFSKGLELPEAIQGYAKSAISKKNVGGKGFYK